MGKRIQFDEDARNALRHGIEQLAGAVRVTLGPRGRNVVIERREGSPIITNDGLTIAREIELVNPFANLGVEMVKEAATRTGEVAGDGTTTATVLAHGVVIEGLRAVAAGCNPMAVKRGIERAVEAVVADLARQARHVSGRAELERVATVAANDDTEIGALVAEALERVGRHGVVTVEDGRALRTTLHVVEGIRFDSGYLSPYFINQPENMESVLEDASVLLAEFKLTSVNDLLAAMELAAQTGRPLLVVAEDIEGEALATLVVNRLRGTVASVAVRAPGVGDVRLALLDDLAVWSGAKLLSASAGDSMERVTAKDLGRARRVLVDKDSTTLVEGGGQQEDLRARIAALTRELEQADSDFDRDRLRERLGRLTGGIVVLRVGGASEVEMRERRARIEDALAATRSALEEGVVPGGGVALLRAQPAVHALELSGDERTGRDIIAAVLEAPARQIAINAGEEGAVAVARIREGEGGFGYDAARGEYVDLLARGIVDAAKVARCALQNAASIATMVLTTDAVVVDSTDEDGGEGPAEEAAD